MNTVGIDYGKKRIGLAKSQINIALPYKLLEHKKDIDQTVVSILQSFDQHYPISKFVVGLPIHMSGKEGEMCKLIKIFAKKLEEISSIEVILFDERLTSKQAQIILQEMGTKKTNVKSLIDQVSASLILQSYLDKEKSLTCSS